MNAMKKLIIPFCMLLLLSIISNASVFITNANNGSIFFDNQISFNFELLNQTDANCSLYVNNSLKSALFMLNSSNYSIAHAFPFIPLNHTYSVNISCIDSSVQASDLRTIIISLIETGLSFTECPQNLNKTLILWLFFIISFVLIGIAFANYNALIGILGALCLIVASMYISACGIGFGLILGSAGVLLIIMFAFMAYKGK